MVTSLRSLCLQVVHENLGVYTSTDMPETLANDIAKISLNNRTLDTTQHAWGHLTEFCPNYDIPEKTLRAILNTHRATLRQLDLSLQCGFSIHTFGVQPFTNLRTVTVCTARMLKKEFLAFCKVIPEGMEQLIFRGCKNIDSLIACNIPKRIRFIECEITSEQLSVLCSKAAGMLEALYFDSTKIRGEQFVLPKLTKFSACGVHKTENGVQFLIALTGVCKESLVSLDVEENAVYFCGSFPALQHLIAKKSYAFQARVLQKLPFLRSLSLTDCHPVNFTGCQFSMLEEVEVEHLSNDQLVLLSAACGNTLHKLIARNSDLSDMPEFNFPELRYLCIGSNITDADLALIGKSCTQLEHLDIRGNQNVSHIDLALFPSLIHLDASITRISKEQREKFQ